jgi:amino acid transporter
VLANVGRALFLTSLLAALLAYHNAVGRYEFSLGRESVLPRAFGLTGRRSGAPWVASLSQSALALVVIAVYAWRHWDPTVKLFFWWGTTGGFGVLALMALTSIAVIAYFARDPQGEPAWRRAYVPAIAAALLVTMVVIAVANYATLLGVPAGSVPAKLLPASFLIPAVIGLVWAVVLKMRRNQVYQGIGLGPAAAAYSGAGVSR